MSAAASKIPQGTATVTIGEAIKLLQFHILLQQVVILFGAPGIGKTDLVKKVVRALAWAKDNLPFDMMICHPQVSDPTDYKGMPGFTTDDKGNKWAEFFAFGDLRRMIEATRPLVVFLDDFGQATKAVQAALQQLILERRIDGHKISDHVHFVLCANRAEDKAGVEGFLSTIKTRSVLYNVEPTVEDWTKWAIQEGDISAKGVAFVRFRGLAALWSRANKNFKGSYGTDNERTPRTVAMALKADAAGIPEGLEMQVFAGFTDGAWATEFMAFSRTWGSLPNMDVIFADPQSFKCPDSSRPEVLYAISAALAERASTKNAKAFFQLIKKLPKDFGAFAVRDAYHRVPEIANTNWFVDWFQSNPEVLEG